MEDAVEYRRLGSWGVKVSVVSLGTWLSHGGRSSEDDAIACTRRAYDLGVNFFDTANEYQHGRAEEVLGQGLAGLPRESFLVGSKVYYPMSDSPLDRGLSRKHIMSQIDKSLSRLRMDYLDLYQCHVFDDETPVEETARAMNDLVAQGKILYWGVSNWSPSNLREAVSLCRARGWAVPVSNQVQYSALWRFVEHKVMPTCGDLGLGVLGWSPLAMGVLSGKYAPGVARPAGTRGSEGVGILDWLLESFFQPGVLEATRELKLLAEKSGHTPAQLALRWCLRRAEASSVIVGASSMAQLEQNVAAGDMEVDEDVLAHVDGIFAPVQVNPPDWFPGVAE